MGLESLRVLTWPVVRKPAICTVILCAGEASLAFGLIFQPSWANGWPGISMGDVFAAVMTPLLLAIPLTALFGLSLLIGLGVNRIWSRPFVGSITSGVVMAISLAFAMAALPSAFTTVHRWVAPI